MPVSAFTPKERGNPIDETKFQKEQRIREQVREEYFRYVNADRDKTNMAYPMDEACTEPNIIRAIAKCLIASERGEVADKLNAFNALCSEAYANLEDVFDD